MVWSTKLIALSLLALSLCSSSCSAVVAKGSQNDNCNFTSPPEDSGEDGIHGNLVKVYPRKSTMGDSYSGCQTVWALDGEHWKPAMIGVFNKGEVTRMKSPARPGSPVEKCLVRSGVLVHGDKDICSALEVFPYSSAPANCISAEKSRDAASCPFD